MTIKNHEFMFDAIGKVRQVTEQRNAIKEALLSERGFTDERQLSLEKRRLLEAKVDEVIARRGGNGGRQSGVISEAKQKMADKDYDKDGKIETSKDEVMGSRMRAAKMAGKMKDDDKTPPFTPDKKTVERGPGGPKSSAKWLAQAAKRRMMTKEEVEQMDEGNKENKKKKNEYVSNIIKKKLSPEVLPSLKYGRRELKKEEVEQMDEAKSQHPAQKNIEKHLKGLYGRGTVTIEPVPGRPRHFSATHEAPDGETNSHMVRPGKKPTSHIIDDSPHVSSSYHGEEVVKEGFFKQREIKKQDAERDRVRGTWEGGKEPYTPSDRDPRVDRVARSAREYEKTQPAHRRGRLPPDLE